MNTYYQIKDGYGRYTETEKRLADYILSHAKEIVHDSAQTLAEKSNTSAAAVIRFSKKVGYRGFTELKVDLAMSPQEEDEQVDDIINSKDTIADLLKKTKQMKIMAINQTYQLMNPKDIELAIDKLNKARYIYLFGVGTSGLVCLDFQQKFSRINRVVLYQSDTHIQLAQAANIGVNDVVIAISYRGKTHEINKALASAKDHGAYTIAITQNLKTPLTKIADLSLFVPSEEKELRIGAISSRMATQVITDLLYVGVAKMNMEDTKERLIASRALIKDAFL